MNRCVYHHCLGEVPVYVGCGSIERAFNLNPLSRTARWGQAVGPNRHKVWVKIVATGLSMADALKLERDQLIKLRPIGNSPRTFKQRLAIRGAAMKNVQITDSLHERLTETCKASGFKVTYVAESCIRQFLESAIQQRNALGKSLHPVPVPAPASARRRA